MHATTVDDWVAQWRERASRAEKLTADEWARIDEAIRDTYRSAGLSLPTAIIRGRSPQEVMTMAVDHLESQWSRRAGGFGRVTEAIRANEQSLLWSTPFSGEIAARVDAGAVAWRAWGTDLHPDMLRQPGAGNTRGGVASEVSWNLERDRVRRSADLRRGLGAIVDRSVAGPARLLEDLVFVSDMPTRFLRDDDGRPHHASGPAIRWSDGAELYFWHGTRVPANFFRWTPERALAEVNVEVRRCAFERLGVDVLEQSLRLLAEAPDPANPPHLLRLYDLPRPWLNGRLLVVDNASVDKGGHRRRFQIFVPPHITNPVEAAANSFGMTVEQYSQLQRAT